MSSTVVANPQSVSNKRKLDTVVDRETTTSQPARKKQKLEPKADTPSVTDNESPCTTSNDVPSEIKSLVRSDKLLQDVSIQSIRFLEPDRVAIYASTNSLFTSGKHVISVEAKQTDSDDDDDEEAEEDSGLSETIVVVDGDNTLHEMKVDDKIMFEPMAMSSCVEYTFDGTSWYVGEIALESLQFYRGSKFRLWRNSMLEPSCEAAFKRLLCIGLITTMFDRFVFASPDHEKEQWMVQDENGRKVDIPRPVKGLRQWNVDTRSYDEVQCHLDGAPAQKDADKYWNDFLDELRTKMGDEYIDDLLESFKTS